MSAREAAEAVLGRERTPAERLATAERRRERAEADSRRYTKWMWVLIVVGALVNGIIALW